MPTSTADRAVVLGGGFAGLLAARVLAEHFAAVTIVERDRLPAGAVHRRGVPHGHHVHGLLPSGLAIAERLLPGLTGTLVARGALTGDMLGNVRWVLGGRPLPRRDTGLTALSASRPLIEGAIRERVLALPNVTALDGYDIVGLRPSDDRRRVTGARVTGQHGEGSRVLPAELVVDATGRGSRTPRWLVELGYPVPAPDRVGIDLWYASCLFTTPHERFGGDIVVPIARHPGQRRSGVAQRLEGDRTLVTLAGVRGQRPPLDLDGFTRYAATLAAPDIHDIVRAARPLVEPVPFHYPTYLRSRYEEMAGFPSGLLAVGDAVCGFNPVYAQGMSVAAKGAMALHEELSRDGGPDPHRYFRALSHTLDAPWALAVGGDLAVLGPDSPVLPSSPLTPEYVVNLQRAAAGDADLAATLVRVTSLVDPPAALLRPEVVARVARATRPAQAFAGR